MRQSERSLPLEVKAILLLFSLAVITGCVSLKAKSHTAEARFSDGLVQQLVRAVETGDVDEIEYLVTVRGVDVDAQGEGGTTPLAWAISAQNYRGAEALLRFGADPNKSFKHGYTPMWFVAGGQNAKLLELLLKNGGNPNLWRGTSNLLILAVREGRPQNYDLLIKYGADVNSTDYLKNNVATYAAYRDKYDMLHKILSDGYSHDLVHLAQLIERTSDVIPASQEAWLEKVRTKIRELGVEYPLPPQEDAEPIRLSDDLREKLENWDKEGKLPKNSKGAELLKLDRALD